MLDGQNMAWDDEALEFVRNQTLYSKEELRDKFGWEEYLVFALMLAVSAGIGVFYWWKGQKDNAEFLLGGKSMGVLPMTMSLVASFMSAITLLGTPSEVYQNGTQYCLLVLSYPFVMAATAYIYMPLLYDLGVSTSYEVRNSEKNLVKGMFPFYTNLTIRYVQSIRKQKKLLTLTHS